MHAYSCCSGGVMFVSDEIERMVKPQSYKDFAHDENADHKRRKLFGRAPKVDKAKDNLVSGAA